MAQPPKPGPTPAKAMANASTNTQKPIPQQHRPAQRKPNAALTQQRSVAILIPTKNEAEGIATTLQSIPLTQVRALGYQAHTVVADGNSKDGTADIAQAHGAQVLRLAGQGKGRDFRLALNHCTEDYIVMLDGDGTYPTEDIPTFIQALQDGADVVMGSRFLNKDTIEPGALSTTNRIGNHLLSAMATLLYGQRTTDVCTGMWAFTRDALAKMDLNSNKFEIEAELFLQATRCKLKVVELPIVYRVRHGESKLGGWKTGLKIGGKLIRQRLT